MKGCVVFNLIGIKASSTGINCVFNNIAHDFFIISEFSLQNLKYHVPGSFVIFVETLLCPALLGNASNIRFYFITDFERYFLDVRHFFMAVRTRQYGLLPVCFDLV